MTQIAPRVLFLSGVSASLMLLGACGPTTPACSPGTTSECPCLDETTSTQRCRPDGTFGACSCNYVTSAEIGPAGGRLELAGAALEIPAGALDTITMITNPCLGAGSIGQETDFASPVLELEPSGLTFATPGTLELPLVRPLNGQPGVLWSSTDSTNLVPSGFHAG